ncbi:MULTISPECIES: DEAD/DEAH box helicase [unclassified Cryobacterium]|uniref:Lhr family ATP-dependent helicase n=1 Tax=unclassified Cryobacterium TaxID=2649013 RepID=UPI002AB3D7A2|nr:MULTISPECIES: DEAD/DEAH box helicase [unclassified Cryobacterium]MDY7543316.1 crosslink repair DNA glycosylase YcaQ family protein [Cryobacterium sp. 5B3]MEB0000480.1 crosslink repair DNA glycosylase YcaQ family protein [Cryobacterium sp. RTS3]MEB0265102.1 crosslink repair DNA glycosylase YcaQ family protein [Cryobacterium sp. 10I5]MEB0276124.1 crosslink repair DNA glycosylase YcaQ family protein [Cryobacterium sp. 5B3]
MTEVLQRFSPATRAWFGQAFAAPTEAQLGAWDAITRGSHALVVAPTGSGKTLAAFLWAIDRLATPAPSGQSATTDAAGTAAVAAPLPRTRVLYISPLKALGVDVERNLRAPLVGITQAAARLGFPPVTVTVGVRSGDTPAADRRTLVKTPPDILITTPESLFLMLTSAARDSLRGVDTVIIDEVHAVASSKRGAHLAVSLERLDELLARPAQRIGLSATVRPAAEVARFLGGSAPVQIVNPAAGKRFDLRVVVPVDDMTQLGPVPEREGATAAAAPQAGSIWPHVEEAIVDEVLAHSSSIVFANSRRLAERLTARFNEIYAGRLADAAEQATGELTPVGAGVAPASGAEGTAGTVFEGAAGTAAGAGTARGAAVPARPPADVMGASGQSEGAEPLLARAHHGSVSKEQRSMIEEDLKAGRLRCVVATSSLELGIDMGAVDLVVQVESPPSVASGLQRVGRAGHQVGEISRGVIYPKHRADLIHAAVAAERMVAGLIESIAVPSNPLDILAQQTVAAVALEPIQAEDWFDIVRRSAPFQGLPRSAYEATLDLLAGRYPSDQFAELRPRIVWDRDTGLLTGRPGAQRLAVTSGGTIPDRGLFGVFMVGGDQATGRRVGELDEEMVYESRVGDVFALGTTSWRIQEITHDRVLVLPAFGEPGRLPFWKGDGLGRPAELGEAVGAFVREVSALPEAAARARCATGGLDERAANNLLTFLADQRTATGQLPTDRTLVVERFRDELGDWRVILHSAYGMQVHAPWALAVAARVRERYGLDGGCVASDDGIVARIPDTDSEPPGAELFVFEAEEIEQLVTDEVGGSALFAARFRECAARALLLPKYNPGTRSPLWQQRQKAAQLLEVAREYPTFPIILETVRECLQDVYDLPALLDLTRKINSRAIRLVETRTDTPSPFASTLLFGYVAAFMYEGDSPLAERRATALSLDSSLLAELLGRVELRELLDPAVIEQTDAELQRLPADRHARGVEGIADLLRQLGPLTTEEVAARLDTAGGPDAEAGLLELVAARRVLRAGFAGRQWWAVIEDASRLRDALGVPVPLGVPAAFTETVPDPLGDLVSRYARTHGPFTVADVADRFGLGAAVALGALRRLAGTRRVIEGEYRPHGTGSEWCDAEVLRRLRRRSLAALRHEVEPVDQITMGRFLPAWQHVGGRLRGVDGVASVIEQLEGARIPASAWESLVLPARVSDYRPAMLDELTNAGEVLWAGAGTLAGNDGWISLYLAETAALTLPPPAPVETTELQREVLATLGSGGGFFFRQLADAVGSQDDVLLADALWDLVWAGLVGNDTFAPVRALLSGGRTAHSTKRAAPRARLHGGRGFARSAMPLRGGPPTVSGRWSIVPVADDSPTRRAHALGETLLERYGVVTRGAVVGEGVTGGFALVYRTLSGFEESGHCRRGYFIDGLGAAQFATAGTIDRLRSFTESDSGSGGTGGAGSTATGQGAPVVVTLAATDPANPYGAVLPWPALPTGTSHRAARKAGAIVVLVDGALVLYVERGGKTVLAFDGSQVGGADDVDGSTAPAGNRADAAGAAGAAIDADGAAARDALFAAAAGALAATVTSGRIAKLGVETVNGVFVIGTPFGRALQVAGFGVTPKGLKLHA